MRQAASHSARRRLEQSWHARDIARCSTILAETLEARGAGADPAVLESVVHALRPMTAEAASDVAPEALAPFRAQREDLFRVAAAGNNDLRIALESDALAAHASGPAWATALFNYVMLRGHTIGARREQLWENVAFVHWAAGHLLRHCTLDETCVIRLLLVLVQVDMHLHWERDGDSVLKLVMLDDRSRLQALFTPVLATLAKAGNLTEPEAFLAFDSDGSFVQAVAPALERVGLRHPNSAALAYFQAHNGSIPADVFLAGIVDIPCMLLGASTAFIVAGEFLPPRLTVSLRQVDQSRAHGVHLTWWLNVNFPREQLGCAAFIASRVPPFVRGLLTKGHATLVLAATGEASWFTPRWIGWMEGIAAALSCRAEQVVYLSQNTRFGDTYRADRAARGLPARFGAGSLNTHFLVEGLRAEPLPAAPTRHFLCFNQRPHLHRAALMLRLQADGHLDKAHFSFNQPFSAEPAISPQALAPWLSVSSADAERLLDQAEPTLPRRLDLAGEGLVTATDGGYVDCFSGPLFADAAVYLVTETEMDGTAMCRFTEKTVKGLAAEIPFIVFGNPGVLASLRELGFRSFAPLIDESYDTIEDPVARFHVAYAEVARLAAMPVETVAALRRTLQPVLQHNRATMLSIGTRLQASVARQLEGFAASA